MILKSLLMLPVYRVRDGWANLSNNETIFKTCGKLFNKNEAIVIFPEGSHNIKRTVRPLSKGFTRIIFETLEQYPNTDLQLIPVGLNFINAEKFPDSAAIFFGAAIPAKSFITGNKKEDVVALRTNDYLVQSLVNSLGIALVFISIVMAFMFRKKSILFASLITNLIPIFTVLGILSWLGISIRPPTAMTFSVALGIAVDDSLHFLLRYRKELRQGMNRVEAIRATIMSTGSALMITTTILVSGFSVLLLSVFLPTYQFGMLSAGMIGTALLCDLTLLPALCLVLPNRKS